LIRRPRRKGKKGKKHEDRGTSSIEDKREENEKEERGNVRTSNENTGWVKGVNKARAGGRNGRENKGPAAAIIGRKERKE